MTFVEHIVYLWPEWHHLRPNKAKLLFFFHKERLFKHEIMLQAANSIFSAHFAVLPAKRSVLERVVAACSDYNSSSFKVPV